MEKYNLTDDVKVFGMQVKTFPQGIGEAFDELVKMIPAGDERPYYGISKMTKDGFMYVAAALQKYEGEAEKYGCENYTVEKGEYLAITVMDWPKKTDSIKDVFEEMVKDERSDETQPCVEIYKNMEEMVCMVKLDKSKEMITE